MSNGVDLVRSLRKITTWLRGTNFCINCTSSVCFAPTFMQLRNDPNAPKYYKMHRNIGIRSNGMDWLCSLRKIPTWLRGTNFCTISARFGPSFVRQPNGAEYTKIIRNAPKHQFRVQWGGSGASIAKNPDVDWVHSFGKFTTWLRGTNFCINCTSSVCFATSFMQLRNDPKCTEILQNGPKH